MRVVVVGTGYVGLVTGTCFAELGLDVTCVDTDEKKIEGLKAGVLPIYEPGLEPMVLENSESGRLHFTASLSEAIASIGPEDTAVYFIAVGTPPGEDGSADLSYVLQVAKEIGSLINHYSVIVDKSTVPVGTADKVKAVLAEQLAGRGAQIDFDVVSNPEFLKEGAAIDDFMRPDRVVIGTDSERAREVMQEIYEPFTRNHHNIVYMGVREAEMTKYAANAMLATKISFMNEIAALCEELGVDVEDVRMGIGSDSRIGYHFIYPGCGYGGSCFPKDVKALIGMARENNFSADVLQAVERRNESQKHLLFTKIQKRFGDDLSGRLFAVWGLAFKPGTDDMREAPSLELIGDLIRAGARISCFDPVAMEQARKVLATEAAGPDQITYCDSQYDALKDADAMILVTEWKPFQRPDFNRIESLLKSKIIYDGRNQYDPDHLRELGFEYYGIGRNNK
ncbi:MAG: UDP-glucose dehydrogenase family protein [Acidiferrobacterales bacterium]